jgi:putative membrane protein
MLEKRGPAIIIVISILVPLVVVVLMLMPVHFNFLGVESGQLPLLHAVINGMTAVLLVTGYVLSALFLVSYVISKISNEPIAYPSDAPLRYLYLFILVSHIVLCAIILPLVLYTVYFSLNKKFEKHKKIASWTFPIWLYVAISGVLVYVFMQPYY